MATKVKKRAHTSKIDKTSIDMNEALGGFKVLKWKADEESSVIHHFFVKAHQNVNVRNGNNPKKPPGKTLLVINIPSIVSENNLNDMFSTFGKITDIFIHQNPTSGLPEKDDPLFPQFKNQIVGYRVAYIVFKNPKSLSDILQLNIDEIEPLILKNPVCGLQLFIQRYNSQIVPTPVLEDNIKKFMENFDRQELKRKKAEENNEGQPDEEGWIQVTRGGSRPGIRRTEETEEKLKEKKKKSEKRVVNFTPRQIKETRARQLEDLKKKFGEDKERIAMMKQKRKFNPLR